MLFVEGGSTPFAKEGTQFVDCSVLIAKANNIKPI